MKGRPGGGKNANLVPMFQEERERQRREAEEAEAAEAERKRRAALQQQEEEERQRLRHEQEMAAAAAATVPVTSPTDEGLCAVALYDYQAAAEDEISFDPNDIISNIEMVSYFTGALTLSRFQVGRVRICVVLAYGYRAFRLM